MIMQSNTGLGSYAAYSCYNCFNTYFCMWDMYYKVLLG